MLFLQPPSTLELLCLGLKCFYYRYKVRLIIIRNMSRQYHSHTTTPPASSSSMQRRAAAAASNGNGTTSHNGGGDLYQQLIDSNDLVKELDDIEAISQQISQHAEVLYQNWKSNSLPRSPTSEQPQRVSSASTTYGAGVGFPKRSIIENGHTNGSGSNGGHHHYGGGQQTTLQQEQHLPQPPLASSTEVKKVSPLSSPTATLTSPSFINKTLPRSNSVEATAGETAASNANSGAAKLDLLASPVVNGNLKDLVNSFVSTDRAKQAARQTISQTITNQMNRKNQFRSPSPSSASSSSSFSSRGMSPPLRSPMLASSLTSPLPTSERRLMDAFPSNASIMNNVHTKMPPLFSPNEQSVPQPLQQQQQQQQPPKWPQEVPESGVIRIPVQHLPSSSSKSGVAVPGPSPGLLNEANLRSPSILHQMTPPVSPVPTSASASIPSLHAAHVENMKKRFEEAKERINAMHQRATSGLPFMASDPFAADELDFFSRNRRQPQRPLIAPPHPELTPQQKQHISERSSPNVNSNALASNNVQPPKRFGGSVAERVMIFERCPIFGTNELKEPRMPALLNTKPTSNTAAAPAASNNATSAAPWRNLQQESMGKIQVIKLSVGHTIWVTAD